MASPQVICRHYSALSYQTNMASHQILCRHYSALSYQTNMAFNQVLCRHYSALSYQTNMASHQILCRHYMHEVTTQTWHLIRFFADITCMKLPNQHGILSGSLQKLHAWSDQTNMASHQVPLQTLHAWSYQTNMASHQVLCRNYMHEVTKPTWHLIRFFADITCMKLSNQHGISSGTLQTLQCIKLPNKHGISSGTLQTLHAWCDHTNMTSHQVLCIHYMHEVTKPTWHFIRFFAAITVH